VLNHTVHEATGSTPSELFLQTPRENPLAALVDFPTGTTFDPKRQLVMAREIQQSKAESRQRRHAEKGNPVQYVIGDLVLVRTHRLSSSVDKCIHKFFMLYEDPFVVKEIKNKNAYVVCDPQTDRVRGCFNFVYVKTIPAPLIKLPVYFDCKIVTL